jgi:hypothetical protein
MERLGGHQMNARITLLLVVSVVSACRNEASQVGSAVAPLAAAPAAGTGPAFVDITWMSISSLYYQLGPLNIVTDGYFTRIPQSEFFGGGGGLAHTHDPLKPDVAAVLRVRDALGGASAVNLLITGHSHFDHAFDTATWANSTGAPIYGSKTTCFQVVAQNIPAAQCTVINGGERLTLSDGVTMRVVRWNHSGDPTTNPEQHNPVELEAAPTLDPATGGLFAGVADAFPNGGGSRGLLFTVNGPQGPFSWFFQNSASDVDLTTHIVVDGVDYGDPLDNLKAAMSDAGLTSVDLWIGTGGKAVAQLVVPVLKPKAYLPVHWDDMFGAFSAGVAAPFSDSSLETFLTQSGVSLVRPHQYMDKWRLDVSGIVAIDNGPVKQALGFCTPLTACAAGKNCGTIPSGCGGTVSCGPGCTAPQTCGGAGTANVCGCTPLAACAAGKNCGTVPDGCGGNVSCGSGCTAPQTCGGAGTANVCGCTPLAACAAGKNCGTVPDGCGGNVSCGPACTAPQTCGGAGTANVCGCTPMACVAGTCGSLDDGCGGHHDCVCPASTTCVQAHCVSVPDATPDASVPADGGSVVEVAGGGGAAGGAAGAAAGSGGGGAADTDGAAGDPGDAAGGAAGAGAEAGGTNGMEDGGASTDLDALGDASGTSDGTSDRDGGVADGKTTRTDARLDGAGAATRSGGGCGCSAGGSATGPMPLLLIAALGFVARPRRGRRAVKRNRRHARVRG